MNFEEAANKALAFRDERDLVVAAKADKAKKEMADVVIYCIYLADTLGVDLADAISSKIDENARKYPADKARGNARKYTEL